MCVRDVDVGGDRVCEMRIGCMHVHTTEIYKH